MDKKIIALFCGSFNPPLNSHFSLAQQLLNEDNNIEKIIFIPVSSKYHKNNLIADNHRFNMLKLVCDNNSKFEVSDVELNCANQPYTIETMREMQKQYPNHEIRLIIGTDNFKELYWWYEINNLLSQFKIIVLARDEDNINSIISNDKLLSTYKDSFVIYNIALRTNLSSTYVRNLIKCNKEIKYLLPDEVIQYIKKNNLYSI